MTEESLRLSAAIDGFEIRPFSPTVVDTVRRVAAGCDTGALLSEALGLKRTAALQRLRRGADLGLLGARAGFRGEYIYEVKISAGWVLADPDANRVNGDSE